MQALRNVVASLRPGGRLYLREPVTHSMTAEEMARLLETVGLRRVRPDQHDKVIAMGECVRAVWEKDAAC